MDTTKIRIIFMAKETKSSIAALQYLVNKKIEIVRVIIRDVDDGLRTICRSNNIMMCNEEDLLADYENGKLSVDYILSFYWKKVRREVLRIPNKGSINFHPGPLPEARGSGYHVAILENWGWWGVTAHFMDENFDTGEIIECRHFVIDSKIVNRDLVNLTHEKLFVLFMDIVSRILKQEKIEGSKQNKGRYFSLRELEEGKLIGKNESAEDIDRKIRAFWNPPYSGAQVEIEGKRYTVINEDILRWIADRLA